ncbi:MAG: DNA repair protein RecN [Erysipelotrichaceae bacterium]|jgi:DNA repair protein RecN (Recombination protein N)|nr:DNA repair protein RecN [Erysipelotrichaceae bacterium]
MLERLWIKNYILIEELELELPRRFSAFTGETGAGKSIFIDALGLLCGERTSADVVRRECDKAIIEGVFSFNHPITLRLLQENGFDPNESTILTREIQSDGKSLARVNHRVVTVSLLRELTAHEIDIHSQRDSQYLLQAKNHLGLIDAYGSDPLELAALADAYHAYQNVKKELDDTLHSDYREEDIEFLSAQIEEIESAKLSENEEESLNQRQKEMMSFEKTHLALSQATSLLESEGGIEEQLYRLSQTLSHLDNEFLQTQNERLQSQYAELRDISALLNDYYRKLEFSEKELNEIQERLFIIARLKRKYGNSVKEIQNTLENLKSRRERISHRQEYIEEMQQKLSELHSIYLKQAAEVTLLRQESAKHLQEQVLASLADLELDKTRFEIRFEECQESALGNQSAEFFLSTNPGEPLRPLIKVASGGELSRLMLGLKSVFSRYQGLSTVVFDEIDTGVSGFVASAIGHKMAQLSLDMQVLAVTHLAPVAACSDQHFYVYKTQEESTVSGVRLLSEEDRIRELALIATGSFSEASLSAARELFLRSQSE